LRGGLYGATFAVDLQTIDEPICTLEGRRVILNESLTSGCLARAGRVCRPDATSPVAAESHIKEQLLVLEFVVDVAIAGKLALRKTPPGRIWISARDIRWNSSSRKEPDADSLARPLGGKDATTVGVEATTIAARIGTFYRTASVGSLVGGIDIAIIRLHGSGEGTSVGDGAACICVQSHRVSGLGVDSFNDV